MRFGGHQTFSIREGWLYKGLRVLRESPEAFGTDALQDRLGVGKNMAKAIHHWLLATGLAEPKEATRGAPPVLTAFGVTVWDTDRYLLEPGTWWLIHTNLVHNPDRAFSWNWFFNRFTATRFERGVVVEGLRRFLQAGGSRVPSTRTLERDVACLLRSYSEVVPREETDPEDILECPMTRLGMLTFSRHSGFYHRDTDAKRVPFPVFCYAVFRGLPSPENGEAVDFSLTELAHRENGPGRIFSVTQEGLFEMLLQYEESGEDRIAISSQAGERIVRIRTQELGSWVREFLCSTSSVTEHNLTLA